MTTDSFLSFLGTWTQCCLVLTPSNYFNTPGLRRAHVGPLILPHALFLLVLVPEDRTDHSWACLPWRASSWGQTSPLQKDFLFILQKMSQDDRDYDWDGWDPRGGPDNISGFRVRRGEGWASAAGSLHHIRNRRYQVITTTRFQDRLFHVSSIPPAAFIFLFSPQRQH